MSEETDGQVGLGCGVRVESMQERECYDLEPLNEWRGMTWRNSRASRCLSSLDVG